MQVINTDLTSDPHIYNQSTVPILPPIKNKKNILEDLIIEDASDLDDEKQETSDKNKGASDIVISSRYDN